MAVSKTNFPVLNDRIPCYRKTGNCAPIYCDDCVFRGQIQRRLRTDREGIRPSTVRNALKHGLTAETIIERLENPEEYRVFEEAVVSEYLPQTPVERELVHRLASLFWRLRRATSIETGLLRMQGEILQAFRSSCQKNSNHWRWSANPLFYLDWRCCYCDREVFIR